MTSLEQLINALYHPDKNVRDEGEAELRGLGSAALGPLVSVLHGQYPAPKTKRTTGLFGLGPSAVELAAEARRRAAALLGDVDSARAADALLAATRDADTRVRHQAAVALGKRRDARAVGSLIEALGSFNFEIRAEAADALGQLGDQRAVEPLIRVMQVDGQTLPRWRALRALGRLGDRRAVPAIIGILRNLLSLPPRDWAPPDPGALGDEQPGQIIWTTCSHALDALERLGDLQALPILDRLALEAPAHTIAVKAARSAERIRAAAP